MAHIGHRVTANGDQRWRVSYRHGGRGTKLATKTFRSEEQAQRYAALVDAVGWQAAEKMLRTGPEVAAERTVAEQVAHHIEHLPRITEGTRSDYVTYSKDINAYLGAVPVSALDRDMVTRFVMKLRDDRGLAPKSIQHRQSLLSAALRAAVRADLILRNVAEGIEIPKPDLDETREMVTLTIPEVRVLLEVTPDYWRPFVATLIGTGMRIQEITALQVGDVDPVAQTIQIRRAWKHTDGHGHRLGVPKSKMSRRTVHAGGLIQVIEPLLDRPADAWLFTNSHGEVVRRQTFYTRQWVPIVEALAARTGKRPRIHDTRHSYASIKLAEGKSMAWLQRQLGHENISTTVGTYGHLQTADLAQLGDVLDWSAVFDRPALPSP